MSKATVTAALAEAKKAGAAPKAFGGKAGHPDYAANVARTTNVPLGRKGYGAGQTECCAFCGRLALGAKFHAFISCRNEFVEAHGRDNDDIGFYPLGSDCARRLKKLVPVYRFEGGAFNGDNFKREG